MSRLSEKRMAYEIAARVEAGSPFRRRRDFAFLALTFTFGIIANFIFSKVEIAAAFWVLMLWAFADLMCTTRPLAAISSITRRSIAAVVVIVALYASSPLLYQQYRVQHAALTSGDLRTSIRDGLDHSNIPPSLKMGGTQLTWIGPNGQPMLKQWSDKVTIRREHNEVKLSTTVRDKNNNLIVKISDNHWEVSPEKTQCWDKNYTDDSLEVMDGRGRVVLQVRVLQDSVQLQVEWPDHNNTLVLQGMYDETDGIRPMFRYPSADHWGELDTSSGYSTNRLTDVPLGHRAAIIHR
jgi:hypothetical protein